MNPSNCNKNTNNTIVQPSNKLGVISKRENNNSYLEHTLSIKTILTEIGMEKYCEIFHIEEVRKIICFLFVFCLIKNIVNINCAFNVFPNLG